MMKDSGFLLIYLLLLTYLLLLMYLLLKYFILLINTKNEM